LGNRGVFGSAEGIGSVASGINGLFYYVTHGYVGLAYSLELPFIPSFGQTSFRAFSSYFIDFFGVNNYWNFSYLVRNEIENGWPALQVWSTIFPWLASDFSFYIIPFIMFFLGKFLHNLWLDFIMNANPYVMLILGQI